MNASGCIGPAATIVAVAGLAVSAAAPTSGAPRSVPRGTIVFASERSGNSQIYSVHADGSRLGQITRNHASDTAPLFSPDGRRIAFARSTRCCSALWVMNANGSRQRPLAAYASDPAWSPDSRRIAYAGSGKSSANSEPLVIADIHGGRRVLMRGRTGHPLWSPDGRWLAFSREVGDRTDLMVSRDGARPRTIRRNAYAALGWTRRGEIMTTTAHGILVIRPDGRGARRLRGVDQFVAPVLSPDGRRFAWTDGRRLRIRALAGGHGRDITPKGVDALDSPRWSADGRSIVVTSLPAGGIFDDVLVVAANGSSSRRITQRVPYPYGSENRQPNWRPRGATPARLGRAPVAPLRSETFSRSAFAASGEGSISGLAADGGRVAMLIDYANDACASVEVWDARQPRVVRLKSPCGTHGGGGSSHEGTSSVALGGNRAAWLHSSGGNSPEMDLDTATFTRRTAVSVAYGDRDDNGIGIAPESPMGDGSLLAFTIDRHCESSATEYGYPEDECPPGKKTGDVIAASIWRVGGEGKCPYRTPRSSGCMRVADATGELSLLAVNAGRIVARTDTGTRLLTEQGAVLRDFVVKARAAALSGNRLALRTATAIEIYDADSGGLSSRIPVTGGVTLDDLEGDLLVTGSGGSVTVRRLGDGRTTTFRLGGTARAQLEQPGLFVAGKRRVTFTPMSALLRRLGA